MRHQPLIILDVTAERVAEDIRKARRCHNPLCPCTRTVRDDDRTARP